MAFRLVYQIPCTVIKPRLFGTSPECLRRFRSLSPAFQGPTDQGTQSDDSNHCARRRAHSQPPKGFMRASSPSYYEDNRLFATEREDEGNSEESYEDESDYRRPSQRLSRKSMRTNSSNKLTFNIKPKPTAQISQSAAVLCKQLVRVDQYRLRDSAPDDKKGNLFNVYDYFSEQYKRKASTVMPHLQPHNLKPYGTGENLNFPSQINRRSVQYPAMEPERVEQSKFGRSKSGGSDKGRKSYSTSCNFHTTSTREDQLEKCKELLAEYKKMNPDYAPSKKKNSLKPGSSEEANFLQKTMKLISEFNCQQVRRKPKATPSPDLEKCNQIMSDYKKINPDYKPAKKEVKSGSQEEREAITKAMNFASNHKMFCKTQNKPDNQGSSRNQSSLNNQSVSLCLIKDYKTWSTKATETTEVEEAPPSPPKEIVSLPTIQPKAVAPHNVNKVPLIPLRIPTGPRLNLLQSNALPDTTSSWDNLPVKRNEKLLSPWPSYADCLKVQLNPTTKKSREIVFPEMPENSKILKNSKNIKIQAGSMRPKLVPTSRSLHKNFKISPTKGAPAIKKQSHFRTFTASRRSLQDLRLYVREYSSSSKGKFCDDKTVAPKRSKLKDFCYADESPPTPMGLATPDCGCVEPKRPLDVPPLKRLKKRADPKEPPKICPVVKPCTTPRADGKLVISRKKLPVIVPADDCPCIVVKMKEGCPLKRLKKACVEEPPKVCPPCTDINCNCPPRADKCLRVTRKCLPKLKAEGCPCVEPKLPEDVPRLKRLEKVKVESPARRCPPPPEPCPPRADDTSEVKQKRLPKLKPSDCQCVEEKPLKPVKLVRIKKRKVCEPSNECPEVKERCDPSETDRADEICKYQKKAKKLPTMLLKAENNHVSIRAFMKKNDSNRRKCPGVKVSHKRKFSTYAGMNLGWRAQRIRCRGHPNLDTVKNYSSKPPEEFTKGSVLKNPTRRPGYIEEDVDRNKMQKLEEVSPRADSNWTCKKKSLPRLAVMKCPNVDIKEFLSKELQPLRRLSKPKIKDVEWSNVKPTESPLANSNRADDNNMESKRSPFVDMAPLKSSSKLDKPNLKCSDEKLRPKKEFPLAKPSRIPIAKKKDRPPKEIKLNKNLDIDWKSVFDTPNAKPVMGFPKSITPNIKWKWHPETFSNCRANTKLEIESKPDLKQQQVAHQKMEKEIGSNLPKTKCPSAVQQEIKLDVKSDEKRTINVNEILEPKIKPLPELRINPKICVNGEVEDVKLKCQQEEEGEMHKVYKFNIHTDARERADDSLGYEYKKKNLPSLVPPTKAYHTGHHRPRPVYPIYRDIVLERRQSLNTTASLQKGKKKDGCGIKPPVCPKQKKMPKCKKRDRDTCQMDYEFKECKKKKSPYPSFSECGEVTDWPKCECEPQPDLKFLQPRYPIVPEIKLLEPTTPEHAQINILKEKECVRKKLGKEEEGETKNCENYEDPPVEIKAKEALKGFKDEGPKNPCAEKKEASPPKKVECPPPKKKIKMKKGKSKPPKPKKGCGPTPELKNPFDCSKFQKKKESKPKKKKQKPVVCSKAAKKKTKKCPPKKSAKEKKQKPSKAAKKNKKKSPKSEPKKNVCESKSKKQKPVVCSKAKKKTDKSGPQQKKKPYDCSKFKNQKEGSKAKSAKKPFDCNKFLEKKSSGDCQGNPTVKVEAKAKSTVKVEAKVKMEAAPKSKSGPPAVVPKSESQGFFAKILSFFSSKPSDTKKTADAGKNVKAAATLKGSTIKRSYSSDSTTCKKEGAKTPACPAPPKVDKACPPKKKPKGKKKPPTLKGASKLKKREKPKWQCQAEERSVMSRKFRDLDLCPPGSSQNKSPPFKCPPDDNRFNSKFATMFPPDRPDCTPRKRIRPRHKSPPAKQPKGIPMEECRRLLKRWKEGSIVCEPKPVSPDPCKTAKATCESKMGKLKKKKKKPAFPCKPKKKKKKKLVCPKPKKAKSKKGKFACPEPERDNSCKPKKKKKFVCPEPEPDNSCKPKKKKKFVCPEPERDDPCKPIKRKKKKKFVCPEAEPDEACKPIKWKKKKVVWPKPETEKGGCKPKKKKFPCPEPEQDKPKKKKKNVCTTPKPKGKVYNGKKPQKDASKQKEDACKPKQEDKVCKPEAKPSKPKVAECKPKKKVSKPKGPVCKTKKKKTKPKKKPKKDACKSKQPKKDACKPKKAKKPKSKPAASSDKCEKIPSDCPPRKRQECQIPYVFPECRAQESPYPSFSECRPPFAKPKFNEYDIARARAKKTLLTLQKNLEKLNKNKQNGKKGSRKYSTMSAVARALAFHSPTQWRRQYSSSAGGRGPKHLADTLGKLKKQAETKKTKSSEALNKRLLASIEEGIAQLESQDIDLHNNFYYQVLKSLQKLTEKEIYEFFDEEAQANPSGRWKSGLSETVSFVCKLNPKADTNLFANNDISFQPRCVGISDPNAQSDETKTVEAFKHLCRKLCEEADFRDLPYEELERLKTEEMKRELEKLLRKAQDKQ